MLAAPAPFHPDPTPGGPPQVSTDGHWWWDGKAWVHVHHAPTAA